jgi:enoyl-[acyl-carrier protein] reductase III
MDIIAKALLMMVQKVVPSMEERGQGNVIAISSPGSQRFIPNYGAIGISKAALESLVKYLAVELAPRNIRVNGVSGGLVDTDAMKAYPKYDEFQREIIRRTPAGRIGQPDDIARIVAFLARPESEWIIGQTIIADGGLSLI